MPNKMGLVIYQPDLNKNNVSPKAEAFCRLLAQQFRINIFDRLVSDEADMAKSGVDMTSPHPKQSRRRNANFFKLCMAVNDGNVDMVSGSYRAQHPALSSCSSLSSSAGVVVGMITSKHAPFFPCSS